jgi:soluble epoxide hydrolase/lipid-phosphate phosphatase
MITDFLQWDYQAYQIEEPVKSAATLDKDPENTIKLLYSLKSKPDSYGKPAWTALVRKSGGWFGKAESAPHVDLDNTSLKDIPDVYEKLVQGVKKNGTFGPNAYYRNQEHNKAYAKESLNGGVLDLPVLFIGAKWDSVCDTVLSRYCDTMRSHCRNLTECTIEAGHPVMVEKPIETNAAIVRWIAVNLPSYFPGYWKTPFVSILKT